MKDKTLEIKMAALKNMHIFLKEVSPDKRTNYIKYVVQSFDDAKQ